MGLFAVREFRALWAAELVSVAGDQLARVALAVLVFDRTASAGWAAAVYALTFLPALAGGVLLGRVADRNPRREVMVGCDVVRAVLVGAMATPGLPLWALCALLVAATVLTPLHSAAQGALLPEILPGPLLESGLGVRQITMQTTQVAGFAAGGVLVATVSPPAALLANAGTFLVSAVLVRALLRARPAPESPVAEPAGVLGGWVADVAAGARTVVADAHRRHLVLAVWLIGIYVVPEALAAPYASGLGAGPLAVGLLMAADPAGSVLGAVAWLRWAPVRARDRAVAPLALLAGVPLMACAFGPGLAVSVVLWALAGAFATACLVQAQASFVRATPAGVRGRAVGLASAGLVAAHGVAALLGGLVAEVANAPSAVALCGLTGAALAAALLVGRLLARRSQPEPSPSSPSS